MTDEQLIAYIIESDYFIIEAYFMKSCMNCGEEVFCSYGVASKLCKICNSICHPVVKKAIRKEADRICEWEIRSNGIG